MSDFLNAIVRGAIYGFALYGLLVIISAMAHAQAVPYVQHTPEQHDRYGGIRNRKGQLCCNREDCKKIIKEESVKILPQGGYTVAPAKAGQPPEHVEEAQVADSPDENWHICRDYATGPGGYTPTGPVRCLLIPQGGY